MKRLNTGIVFLILTLVCASLSFAQIKTDAFFPDTTKGYVSINNVNDLRTQWQTTEIGQIIMSDQFKDFRQSIFQGLEKSWTGRVGMSIQDTLHLASGEAAFGLVAAPGKTPGFIIAIDVTDKKKEVDEFLTRLIRQSFDKKSGTSKKDTIQISATQTIPVTVLVLPPDNQYPAARTAYYAQVNNFLFASDQKELLAVLLNGTRPLNKVPAYAATMERCQADFAAPHEPQIRYFISPLEFGKAVYALSTPTPPQKGASPFDVLAKQGFDAVQGVGGTLDFSVENLQFISRTKVYIPANLRKSVSRMFSLIEESKLTAPDWVVADVNSCTIVNIDLLSLFNNIGPLFDGFLDTPGLWEETLEGLEKDEQGPKVNLKTQLIANLGTQITTCRAIEGDREQIIGAIQIKEGKEAIVSNVFHRMFDTDPDFQKTPFGKGTIWLYAPKAKTSAHSARSRRGDRNPPQQAQAQSQGFVKNAFYVGNGNIFFSNDIDMLKASIEKFRTGQGTPLESSPSYQRILAYIAKFSGNGCSSQSYAANKKGIQANYELFRTGRFLEGNTLMARIFKRILTNPDKSVNSSIKIDGSKLPPFNAIKGKVGAAGAFGKSEQDGYFIKGFGISNDQLTQ